MSLDQLRAFLSELQKNKELFNKISLLENEGLKKIKNAILYINKNINVRAKIDNWVIKNLERIVKNLAEEGYNFPFEIKFSLSNK